MQSDSVRCLLDAALKQNLFSFVVRCFQTVNPGKPYQHNWHIEVMVDKATRCMRSKGRRQIISVPPRHLKSLIYSVALPAFLLMHDPTRRVICTTYSLDLAIDFAARFRAIINSDWYRRIAPHVKAARGGDTAIEFTTTEGGGRLAVSVGSTLTGRGGDLIIIDDPMPAQDAFSEARRQSVTDWFQGTLLSRLDDKRKGTIIIVTQRLHPDDLVGHCLAQIGWKHLCLPAVATRRERFKLLNGDVLGRQPGELLHPDRESQGVLDHLRVSMGSYAFAAQYMQEPLPVSGNLIQKDWFQTYGSLPDREADDFVTISVDTAAKDGELNDFSVAQVWLRRGEQHYLIDVFRQRVAYSKLRDAIIELWRYHRPDALLIEDSSSGTALLDDLRQSHDINGISIRPEGNKLVRMNNQSAKIEAGQVHLPQQAPWLDEFMAEVLLFPNGSHDDQIDAMSQYLGWDGSRRVKGEIVTSTSRVAQEWELNFGHNFW